MNITKVIFILICFLAARNHSYAQGAPDRIIGLYWSPKKDAKIEIYKKGDRFFGRSVWLAAPKKDIANPDKLLRQRDVLGVDLLTNFRYDAEDYTGGKVYDPANGKTYNCEISFTGQDLKVRGYIGISLLGRTEIFERVK